MDSKERVGSAANDSVKFCGPSPSVAAIVLRVARSLDNSTKGLRVAIGEGVGRSQARGRQRRRRYRQKASRMRRKREPRTATAMAQGSTGCLADTPAVPCDGDVYTRDVSV